MSCTSYTAELLKSYFQTKICGAYQVQSSSHNSTTIVTTSNDFLKQLHKSIHHYIIYIGFLTGQFFLLDPRVKDWPLVQDVRCPLAAITCYILIVIIGPKLMRNRKALEVKFLMTVYNLLAVILSAYMLIKVCIFQYCIISTIWFI